MKNNQIMQLKPSTHLLEGKYRIVRFIKSSTLDE